MTKKENEHKKKIASIDQGIDKLEKIERKLTETENKMGVLPVNELIWKMSVPAMLSMLINALYNIVSSIFVSHLDTTGKPLAAVTLAFPIQFLIIAVAVGTGVGINSLIARRLGAKRYKEANSAANHGFIIALISWIFFAAFGIFFADDFIRLYTSDPYIQENATIYLSTVTTLSVFMFITITAEKTLQATGNMLFPMIFNIAGAVINVILDPILIFGLLGAPKMGVPGAAVGAVIAQFCAMSIALFMLFKYDHHVKISYKGFRLSLKTIKDIYSVGLPTIIMMSIGSVMITFLNGILIKFSETAVAVLGAYFRLNTFLFMPVFGLNQGILPIIGYNFGAGNKGRLLKAYKSGLMIALIVMALGTLLFWVITEQFLLMFNADAEMMEIGIPALRTISLCFVFAAFSIITTGMFQALGHGFLSMMVALLRQLILIVPLSYVLSHMFGLNATWFSFPVAELLSNVLVVIFLRYIYKKEIKPLGN